MPLGTQAVLSRKETVAGLKVKLPKRELFGSCLSRVSLRKAHSNLIRDAEDMLKDRNEALLLLKKLGATPRLVHHSQTVGGAADAVIHQMRSLSVNCDARLIEMGAILHDAGKIQHPQELAQPGTLHEQAGEGLLLSHGVQPEVARFCVSHAQWNLPGVSLEERVVALADKLWKGKREPDLELAVVDEVAARLGCSRWDVFEALDNTFEKIAAAGAERLEHSRSY
jgi:putative nucleotidyltransferase with HDIG domain